MLMIKDAADKCRAAEQRAFEFSQALFLLSGVLRWIRELAGEGVSVIDHHDDVLERAVAFVEGLQQPLLLEARLHMLTALLDDLKPLERLLAAHQSFANTKARA